MEAIKEEMLKRVLTIITASTGCITCTEEEVTKIYSFDDYHDLIIKELEENGGKLLEMRDIK